MEDKSKNEGVQGEQIVPKFIKTTPAEHRCFVRYKFYTVVFFEKFAKLIKI